jgi:hypothetical protein
VKPLTSTWAQRVGEQSGSCAWAGAGGARWAREGRRSLGAGVRWLDGRKRAGPTLHVCRATTRAACPGGQCVKSRNPIHHPAASAEPPTPSRGLRAAARPCASSALRRVVATVEDGLSATAGHPHLWGRGRRQREPGSLCGDAAGYIRRPRRSRPGATKDPLGNRGVGDLTTNMTHTTPLARMASSRILLARPWADEDWRLRPTAWYSDSSDSNQCVVS